MDRPREDEGRLRIPFTCYFYVHTPLRPLAEIDAELRARRRRSRSRWGRWPDELVTKAAQARLELVMDLGSHQSFVTTVYRSSSDEYQRGRSIGSGLIFAQKDTFLSIVLRWT